MSENSSIVYLKTIIELQQSMGYCPWYSSLVSAFAPLNLLFLPTIPFVIYMNCERFNEWLLWLQFLPFAMVGVILWILFVIPLTFLITLFGIFMRLWMLFDGNFIYNLKQYFLYLLLSPFMFVWNTVLDFFNFLDSIYCDQLAEAR